MQLRFLGQVIGFLTLLINAITGVKEVVNPILAIIEAIKGVIHDKKGGNDSDLKNITEALPASLKGKVVKALPKAIENLGIPLEEKGNVLKNFITYVEAQPDAQRGGLYSKLASNLYREVEGKVTEVEADTLVQLHYLKGKMDGRFSIASNAETGIQAPDQ